MTITDLAVRMATIERRLGAVEQSIHAIERRLMQLDELHKVVGDLKVAIEEMQEV